MPCPALLCSLLLLHQIQGSSAGTPVFVPTGGDLNLDVLDADFPKTFDFFLWKFKTETVMVTFQPNGEPNIREEYRGRIEVSEKKYSVRLKHLTKGDSGTYVARVTSGKDLILAEYDVTVQDPVSPVDLISDSVFNNSTCNVTAACTTPESSISSSFRCDAKTCYQEGGRSEVNTSGISLRIYLSAESIICNHSNQVSWLKNETNLRSFCPKIAESTTYIWTPVIVVAVILSVAAMILLVSYWRRRVQPENTENAIYATPETHNIQNSETQADAAEVESPSTTYSLVGPATERTDLPSSLYATVQKIPE
uniref:Immunoglobulin subtype domain-containing protein n=1 Tax=Nothobranchius kadleci TaxID=1051664 RepID=A0A1A8C0G5_NOTKA